MKVLFLTPHINDEAKAYGGLVGAMSIYKSVCAVVGTDDVEIISLPNKRNLIKRYVDYLFLRNMYSKKQEKEITDYINECEYDVLFLDGSWFGNLLKNINNKKNIVMYMHNIEVDYSLQRMKNNPLTFLKYRSVKRNELSAVNNSKRILVCSDRDQILLEQYYSRKSDGVFSALMQDQLDERIYESPSNRDKYIFFLGSYFAPNVEGIKWFARKVVPFIKYKLIIAGRGMEKIKNLQNERITVLGSVDDISELYAGAIAVVMPIFMGGGIKIKTAEAMMYGKRIFATKEALTGYKHASIENIYECNSAEEFIDSINSISDEQRFFHDVRQLFLDNYEQKNNDKLMQEIFDSI